MLLVVIPDNIVNDGPGTTFTRNVLFVYLFLPGLSDRPVLGSCDVPSLQVLIPCFSLHLIGIDCKYVQFGLHILACFGTLCCCLKLVIGGIV